MVVIHVALPLHWVFHLIFNLKNEKMKNKIKYLFLVVLVSGFVGCSELLEEVPVSDRSIENSFKTEADAIAAIVGVYNSLHLEGVYGKSQTLFSTDEHNAGSKVPLSGLNTFNFTADNVRVRIHTKGWRREQFLKCSSDDCIINSNNTGSRLTNGNF